MKKSKAYLLIGLLVINSLATACTVQHNAERIYTLEIDEKETSLALDKAIEADRNMPHLSLAPDRFGILGPRLVSLSPLADVREGVMVSQDARTHSKDVQKRLKAMPNVEITRTIEAGDNEGGEAMIRSLASHPVMLARMRFDCKRNLVTQLSYHTSDTFDGPFTYSFNVQNPQAKKMAGPMLEAACTGAPSGLKNARDNQS